jgi:hypothetical protein
MIGRTQKGHDDWERQLAYETGWLHDLWSDWHKTLPERQAYVAECYAYACDNDCSLGYHTFKTLNAEHFDECYDHECSYEEACYSDECYLSYEEYLFQTRDELCRLNADADYAS